MHVGIGIVAGIFDVMYQDCLRQIYEMLRFSLGDKIRYVNDQRSSGKDVDFQWMVWTLQFRVGIDDGFQLVLRDQSIFWDVVVREVQEGLDLGAPEEGYKHGDDGGILQRSTEA